MADEEEKVIATNRKARFEYEILERLEAGIALLGPEVKSLREGRANLVDSYATVRGGEALLRHLHISPYEQAGRANLDPTRERKLLLHRREISRWASKVAEKGLTVIPLNLHWTAGRAKVELGLARGKKNYDRRRDIAARDAKRDMDREISDAMRGR